MVIALGSQYSGVYSSSDSLWHELHAAGEAEYDRFWRMPLDHAYAEQIGGSNADLCNVGGRAGGACTAAWFLRNFVDGIDSANAARWAHIDIAGSMEATKDSAYQRRGMTGRPTRALLEFARRSAALRP
ncbi:peptidase M17, leucyl aminopeptidase [Auriculariales sp. MPI-PUGE-AT-0066]|nr:peptidase M17, leucyl aminopeptidase [Auriculariales sp. MPI-PUGE-AT-0066]